MVHFATFAAAMGSVEPQSGKLPQQQQFSVTTKTARGSTDFAIVNESKQHFTFIWRDQT